MSHASFPAFLTTPIQQRTACKSGYDLLFASWQRQPLRNDNFRTRVFDPTLTAIWAENPAFPIITQHDLRHTAASLAVSAGANVKAAQRMLEHASAAMTLDMYAGLFDEDLSAFSEALNREAGAHFAGRSWTTAERPTLG